MTKSLFLCIFFCMCVVFYKRPKYSPFSTVIIFFYVVINFVMHLATHIQLSFLQITFIQSQKQLNYYFELKYSQALFS